MSRQIGFVLGVAILVAILGDGADFDGAWLFMIVAAALGSVAALAIGPVRVAMPMPAAPAQA
jgi:hypothetical protein